MLFLVLLSLLFANNQENKIKRRTKMKKKPRVIGQFGPRRGIISIDSHAVYKQNGRDGRNS